MKRRVRTTWIGAGLLAALLGGLVAAYFGGALGIIERPWTSSSSFLIENVPPIAEIDVAQVCREYWTTIQQADRPPHSVVVASVPSGGTAGRDGAGRDGAGRDGAGRDGAGRDGASSFGVDEAAPPGTVDFARDIRPILVEHCYECHGPDEQQAGVRFDEIESLFREAESGERPVVAGDAEQSSLITRVMSDDAELRMPAEADPLSPPEIALLREWVGQGARLPEDARHWAFVRPQRPPLPPVADRKWPKNPIDHFVLARLEQERLAPSPEADRQTLVRRLSLDLTGLPPSPEEVECFLQDRSEDAYRKLVDRLLASPHYGERWAVRWLDLARYADTNGFGYDAEREIWQYRDWVIHALNMDKPFDVFTVEQLAGDLLPNSSPEQKVATGFIRCSAVQADLEQQRFEVMVDRVNTVGTVWLGLSVSCAQCHDHKFDPISQKEYYQLFAMFNNAVEEVEEGRLTDAELEVRSPLNNESSATLVVEESPEPNLTHLKIRGGYLNNGDEVQPGVPGSLHPPACGATDRLGLACWLVDPANPLTARVTVNRFWEAIWGIGLVRTSEDLGTRSEAPSHPQLLDWLAAEFQQNGWSMKALLRLLVTSAAYRQSSHVGAELLERDPDNRLLARGPRFRVDAEFVRDIVLAASGTLSDHMGGPSVFPPQPPGITEDRLFGSFRWRTSHDEKRSRRGLYTYWKRSAMYPSFATFDAPSRTVTCPRRARSTTPLQALVTLNDPAFFEAAVSLGRRMMSEGGRVPTTRISRGFQLCLSRQPNDEELERLLVYYREERQRWEQDPAAAIALLGGGRALKQQGEPKPAECAAWAMVANVLLNLDETITKE